MKFTGKILLAKHMVQKARIEYKTSYFSVLTQLVHAYRKEFSPTEIAAYDLLNSKCKTLAFGDCVSKERLLHIQESLNPAEFSRDTDNKELFDDICRRHNLPVPKLAANIVNDPVTGITVSGVSCPGSDDLFGLLSGLEEGEYVLKPSEGCYGRGLYIFNHTSDDHGCESLALLISQHLGQFTQFHQWLIQARLHNHPEILLLSPSKALQTARVVTCVEKTGHVHVLAAQWRLAISSSLIDNFSFGQNKGLLCNIFPDTGKIETCYRGKDYPFEFGLEIHSTHPETGEMLVGRTIPCWEDVLDLARRAATAFLPSLSIGWDIAITESGPVLIEGNRYWDPHNEDGRMSERVKYLLQQSE